MAADNLDAFNLKSANLDGVINEDVLQQIFDISKMPLPLTERIGSMNHDNQYFSWRQEKLNTAATDGQRVDGQDLTGNDSKTGRRVGNHSEIRSKRISVSTRAQKVDTIGYANELARQVSERNIELRQDVEATALSNNGSVEGTDTVAGVTAGLNAWLTSVDVEGGTPAKSNVVRGALGDNGGWDDTVGDGLVAAATPGTPEAITEKKIRDVAEAVFSKGGEVRIGMCSTAVKRLISEYLFTSSARIATMINDSPSGDALQRTAQGSVDLFITDYGSIELVPNRFQPEIASGNETLFLIDPAYLSISYLQGYMVEPQAKTGLADNRQISVDWGLRVHNWDAHGAVCDIDPTAAMTA